MFTVTDVADQLNVSATCVYQLIAKGKLACHRIGVGRGVIRISDEDLATYVDGSRLKERPTKAPRLRVSNRRGEFKHLRVDG